ncbi:peptide-N(4)-(N-acetyl-beta-glucosaminyl)asparagine amidase-like [Glandiceps talaboti]
MKQEAKTDEVERPEHVFQLSEKEKKEKFFRLKYSAKENKYYRHDDNSSEIDGWQNGVYTMVNLRRYKKENNDEELVYLTRKPGCASASVSWKFDFRDSDLVIDNIQAITYSRTESEGKITYDMATKDYTRDKTGKGGGLLLNGWQTLLFIAYLDGGVTPYELSQTQFLYQNVTREPDFCPLDIIITLKPLEKLSCTCNLKKECTTDKDKMDKHKFTSNPDEDIIEPVCTCDKCTCKRTKTKRKQQ